METADGACDPMAALKDGKVSGSDVIVGIIGFECPAPNPGNPPQNMDMFGGGGGGCVVDWCAADPDMIVITDQRSKRP